MPKTYPRAQIVHARVKGAKFAPWMLYFWLGPDPESRQLWSIYETVDEAIREADLKVGMMRLRLDHFK